MPTLSAYNVIRIYWKVEDFETKNKTCVDTGILVWENGGSPAWLHLVTKFRGRWELGLPTSSSAVHLWKMMLHTMFRSMQTFCEQQISYTFTLCVCVCMCSQTGLLFIIFVCSLYSPWATIRLLHHFGFACALILGYPVCVFRAIHAKYVMFRVGWRMSLKGSATHVRHKKMAMHLSLKPKYFQYTHSRCITSDFVLTWPSAVDRMFKLLTTFKSWH